MRKRFLILGLGIIVASCGGGATEYVESAPEADEYIASGPTQEESSENLSREEMFSTIESTSKYIQNTVWTHTVVGSAIWYRFEFSNGRVKKSSAFPRNGKWGDPQEYDYEIKERRYSDTGNRYISIIINGDEIMNWELCPEMGILRTEGGKQVPIKLGDYQWD